MSRARALLLLGPLLLASACRRKHVAVDHVPQLPYPSCGDAPLPDGEVLAEGYLRAGPYSVEHQLTERFSLRHRACLYTLTVHEESPLVTDVEVVYDERLVPLRAWKRHSIPTSRGGSVADTRRYELRTPEVTITRSMGRTRSYEILRGDRPTVVLGPGRGLLTAWLRRAHLGVGERVREVVLDVREPVEVIRLATLRREPDQRVEGFARPLRVYTFYGRESVFADESDAVVGDLAGLRSDSVLTSPAPPPQPTYGAPDPVHTP